MITAAIYYSGREPGLSQLIVALQPQLNTDDDIYVIDCSDDRSGVEIVKKYGSTRCYIFVEPTKKRGFETIKFPLQSMKQNKQQGIIFFKDDMVISNNFVANIKRAAKKYDYLVVNKIYNNYMVPEFKVYTSVVEPFEIRENMEEYFPYSAPDLVYVNSKEVSNDYTIDMSKIKVLGFLQSEKVVVLTEDEPEDY